ncbi:MAG: septum formation initiator family protein [Chthoniobacterales bacterium]
MTFSSSPTTYYSLQRGARAQQHSALSLANRFLILLILCGILALGIITFYPEWKKLRYMRAALQKDNQELAHLEKQASHREHELYLLQHDKEYLEMIARDRLDLMKPNETIFRLGPARSK